MFVSGTSEWSVRVLDGDTDNVYLVHEKGSNRQIGVASGYESLEALLLDVITDVDSGKIVPGVFNFTRLRFTKRGVPRVDHDVMTVVPKPTPSPDDEVVEADTDRIDVESRIRFKSEKKGRRP